jgi:type I restriction enzyme S subunit
MIETQEMPLNKLADFIRGVTFDKSDESKNIFSDSIPVLRAGNIQLELDIENDLLYIPSSIPSKEQFLKKGDFAICISSGSHHLVGKTAELKKDFFGTIGGFCGIIRPKNELYGKFLKVWLKGPEFKEFRSADASGSNIQNLQFSNLPKIKTQLPKDLKKLETFLDDTSDKLSLVELMRQAALKQKEAVEALQGALLREVFPYKAGDELPKGWKWEKIDTLAKVSKVRKKKTSSNPKEPTSFVPMDSVNEFTGSITKVLFRPYDELGQSYTYFENGDIIFAKITPCMQNGKCAIVSDMKDGFGYGSSEYIVLTPIKTVYAKWVHYFLRTVEFRRAAEEHFTGSAGQQRVPIDFVQKYPIPVPEDEALIDKLTSKLDKKHEVYFKLITKAETQLEAIEAMPAAILREVFDFKTNKN